MNYHIRHHKRHYNNYRDTKRKGSNGKAIHVSEYIRSCYSYSITRDREREKEEKEECALYNFIRTWCSSDGGNHGSSAQQQSYSENDQLHFDREQLRESLKKIMFSPT